MDSSPTTNAQLGIRNAEPPAEAPLTPEQRIEVHFQHAAEQLGALHWTARDEQVRKIFNEADEQRRNILRDGSRITTARRIVLNVESRHRGDADGLSRVLSWAFEWISYDSDGCKRGFGGEL